MRLFVTPLRFTFNTTLGVLRSNDVQSTIIVRAMKDGYLLGLARGGAPPPPGSRERNDLPRGGND